MAQLKLQTKRSIAPVLKESKQSGFVILMALLVLVLGAAAWYGSIGSTKSESMKSDVQADYVANLQHVKERMLAYAVLNPEIFDEGIGDTSNPGLGYFPCPDVTGDGISDTGLDCSAGGANFYTIGWVPQKIIDRNFSFLSSSQAAHNKRYWFAVDNRFLVDGRRFRYGASNRFAPLNINTPSLVDVSLLTPATDPDDPSYCNQTPASNNAPGCAPPLTLDGEGDIVMVLFYSGDGAHFRSLSRDASYLTHAHSQITYHLEQPVFEQRQIRLGRRVLRMTVGPGEFISKGNGVDPFNDYVIAITREEWNAAMLSRVAKDVDRDLDGNGLLDAEEDIDGDGFPDGNPVPDGVPDLCVLVDADVSVKEKNSWFNDCRYSGGIPPYPCTDVATLPPTLFPVENIEGQGWRTALGCP